MRRYALGDGTGIVNADRLLLWPAWYVGEGITTLKLDSILQDKLFIVLLPVLSSGRVKLEDGEGSITSSPSC